MKYSIRKSYPFFLGVFAAISAGVILVVAFVPECNPEDWRWGFANVAMGTGSSAFLAWYAWRMSRLSFEITAGSLIERDGEVITKELELSAVESLTNRPRGHVVEVRSRLGTHINIPYQINGIGDLVDQLVVRIGIPVR